MNCRRQAGIRVRMVQDRPDIGEAVEPSPTQHAEPRQVLPRASAAGPTNICLVRPPRGGLLHRNPGFTAGSHANRPSRILNPIGTIRGSFETMPAGPDHVSAAETWPSALPLSTPPLPTIHGLPFNLRN
jgi:hypothetical protein